MGKREKESVVLLSMQQSSEPLELHGAPGNSAPPTAMSSRSDSNCVSPQISLGAAVPSNRTSKPRIRRGLLSRAGSEVDDRKPDSPLLHTSDDEDQIISDSGSLSRRFPSISSRLRGPTLSPRQSSFGSPVTSFFYAVSGNQAAISGDLTPSDPSVSLGRAKSVSSVSSVNSTSSLEAMPFREAPLGNVRFGVGGLNTFRSSSRHRPALSQMASQPMNHQPFYSSPASASNTPPTSGLASPHVTMDRSTEQASSTKPRVLPKPVTDAWLYRNGPGIKASKGRQPLVIPPSAAVVDEQPTSTVHSAPSKRSRDALRQKFVKGAGKLGIKTSASSHLSLAAIPGPVNTANPMSIDSSSEDEPAPTQPSRSPHLSRTAFFSSGPHSPNLGSISAFANSAPVQVMTRTSSITNAPLIVSKFLAEIVATDSNANNQSNLLLHIPESTSLGNGLRLDNSHLNQTNHATTQTRRDSLARAASTQNTFDRPASLGPFNGDDSLASNLPESSSFADGSADITVIAHPTPAEIVRLEAQAGIVVSLPDCASTPSPAPVQHSDHSGKMSESNSDASSVGGIVRGRQDSFPSKPRFWVHAKRPAPLRTRTSETSPGSVVEKGGKEGRESLNAPQSPNSSNRHQASDAKTQQKSPLGKHAVLNGSNHCAATDGNLEQTNLTSLLVRGSEPNLGGGGNSSHPHSHHNNRQDQHYPTAQMPINVGPSRNSLIDASNLTPTSTSYAVHQLQPPISASPISPASLLGRSADTIRYLPVSSSLNDSDPGPLPKPNPTESFATTAPLPTSASASAASFSAASNEQPRPTAKVSARSPQDFHFGETLGEGSYSTVLEAWDLLSGANPKAFGVTDPNATSAAAAMVGAGQVKGKGRIDLTGKKAYAIKVLDKVHILKQNKQKYVTVEKETLSRLIKHPGVVTLYWTFQDRDSLYFVLELACNGELLSFIRKYGSFDEACAQFYAAQLVDTIDGMHKVGVIHRDIKPENILLDSAFRIKVTDFGSAKIVAKQPKDQETQPKTQETVPVPVPVPVPTPARAASFVGTAEYVSPELLVDKVQPAGMPADWWAFGCVLFQMIASRPPFKGVNEYQTLQKVKNREFSFPLGFPDDARDLIDRLLVLEPENRLKSQEIKNHVFFQGIDFATLWEQPVPPMRTGIVQPVKPPSTVSSASEFSFDEGFASEEESETFRDDAQSFETRGGDSVPESSRAQPDGGMVKDGDANDSDFSDASSEGAAQPRIQTQDMAATTLDASQRKSIGRMRIRDGSQGRTSEGSSSNGVFNLLATAGTSGPRRRFSTLSIDTNAGRTLKEHEGAPSHRLSRESKSPMRTGPGGPNAIGRGLQTWNALLLPHELMLYSCPVSQKKTGAGKMFTRRRQLILTDFPRLLCIKESTFSLKVKSEVILGLPYNTPTPGPNRINETFTKVSGSRHVDHGGEMGDHDSGQSSRNSKDVAALAGPNMFSSIEYKGGKMFIVRTSSRAFVYEVLTGDASLVVRSIQDANQLG